MALRDHERRILAEMEQRLAEENPKLARRFADFRPIATSAVLVAGLGLLMLLGTGLVIMVVGVQVASAALIVSGSVLTAVAPVLVGWFVHRRGRPPYR